jgi:hypothetical protein
VLRREGFRAIEREENLNGSGFSVQSVPSLSNVAMRSGTGTKSGEPSFVTLATKSRIAFLVLPSLHEGSGSVLLAWVAAGVEAGGAETPCVPPVQADASTTTSHTNGITRFMYVLPHLKSDPLD